ncbi:unnamed protein product [Paramecium octaurelia]|uniref:Uncharacterized protein n=1 Tax=Paramecium octaurelia TaxID=43137 RepID=A0A8S1WS25_PAROT|nr:unnamed protein product [Paramecium octaurelia]
MVLSGEQLKSKHRIFILLSKFLMIFQSEVKVEYLLKQIFLEQNMADASVNNQSFLANISSLYLMSIVLCALSKISQKVYQIINEELGLQIVQTFSKGRKLQSWNMKVILNILTQLNHIQTYLLSNVLQLIIVNQSFIIGTLFEFSQTEDRLQQQQKILSLTVLCFEYDQLNLFYIIKLNQIDFVIQSKQLQEITQSYFKDLPLIYQGKNQN